MNRCCALLFAPLLLLLPLLAMAEPEQPDPYTVQHWGKGYRFAQQGWISVHIEGAPLERGLQHGHLLAPEIAAYIQAMALFTDPKHPYTIGLMQSKPIVGRVTSRLYNIPGQVPNPINMPNYCYFRDRCEKCIEKCGGQYPPELKLSDTHFVSCYLYDGEGAQK